MMEANVKAAIEALNLRYLLALDGKDMAGWLACFAQDPASAYHCISAENVEHGFELGFMYDDSYARLQDRVTYITEIWKGTFQDYRTRHFVQTVRIAPVAGAAQTYEVLSNFNILYTPDDTGQTDVLASGRYEDTVRLEAGEAKLLTRRAVIDAPVLPRYLVYPL